jgi:hypothetical protein
MLLHSSRCKASEARTSKNATVHKWKQEALRGLIVEAVSCNALPWLVSNHASNRLVATSVAIKRPQGKLNVSKSSAA